jgi:hypothetical protein
VQQGNACEVNEGGVDCQSRFLIGEQFIDVIFLLVGSLGPLEVI